MPLVCTSQPAKAELQVPKSTVFGSTTAGDRGFQILVRLQPRLPKNSAPVEDLWSPLVPQA